MRSSPWWTKLVDTRKGARLPGGGLAVYYWTGGRSDAHPVREISLSGAVIETSDRYSPGTLIQLALGRMASAAPANQEPFNIWARVVRQEQSAVCVKFVFADQDMRKALRRLLQPPGGNTSPTRAGQALIEFAVSFPLLFLLIVNVANFGGLLYAWVTVSSAARTGAQYLIMGGATVGGPAAPTPAAVGATVLADLSTLPNKAGAQICVCLRGGGTVSCSGTGTGTPPVDPAEAGVTYVVGSVDVFYPYTPYIPLPRSGLLGFHLTVPPLTVHRQVAMRVLQ